MVLTVAGVSYNLKGIFSRHSISFDGDGNPIKTGKNTVTLVEKQLTDLGFVSRHPDGKFVELKNSTVTYKDSTGLSRSYKVISNNPDSTIGIFVLDLSTTFLNNF